MLRPSRRRRPPHPSPLPKGRGGRRRPCPSRRRPSGVPSPQRGEGQGEGGLAQHKANGHGRLFASPLARRLAAQAGIDLSLVKGSGPHGRIVKHDVDEAQRAGVQKAPEAAAAPLQQNGLQALVPSRAFPGGDAGRSDPRALREGQLRNPPARQYAQDHRAAADPGGGDDPAFPPQRGLRDRCAARCTRAAQRPLAEGRPGRV